VPMEPTARQQTQKTLEEWILQPHTQAIQIHLQRKILPWMKEAAGVTDVAIQVRCNGERKFLVWVGDSLKFFNTPLEVVEWLAECQKAKEQPEPAQRQEPKEEPKLPQQQSQKKAS
jgi:hypothetical protein